MYTKKAVKKGMTAVLLAMMTVSVLAGCKKSSTVTKAGNTSETQTTESAVQSNVGAIPAPTIDTSRKSTANSDGKYEKITIGLADDPKDLGPTGYGATSYMIAAPNYMETLFDIKDNDYVPILAKGYTKVDDTHWEVQLYDNIYDSEGNHITASDVVYSIKLLQDSGKAVRYDYFQSAVAKDDYTVEFTWTKPVDSIGALEWPWCRTYIVSQKAYEAGNFTSAPVGTGPYKVSEYVAGSHLTLTANDKYWQSADKTDPDHKANVKTIEYDIIAETSQHVIALSTNQIQYSQYIPGENLKDFEEGGQYADKASVYITQGSALEVLMGNNTEGKITADPNFRKAMWYAIDNNAVAASVGTYLPSAALGTPFFSDYDKAWETDSENYMASMNLDKAKEYLAKTSYKGETLKLMGTSDEATKSAMTMIQTLLLNAGIKTEIKAEDGTMLEDDMLNADSWDILYKDCGGSSQVGEWNRFVNYNEFGTGKNMSFIQDDQLQKLYETASSISGHTKENMNTIHNYILQNGYYYALCSPEINAVYSKAFASLAYHEGEFLRPGACDYYLD